VRLTLALSFRVVEMDRLGAGSFPFEAVFAMGDVLPDDPLLVFGPVDRSDPAPSQLG